MSEEQKELSVACQSLGDWTRTHTCGQRTCDQQQSYGEYFFNVKHTVCQLGAGYRRLKSFINDVT